MSTLAPSFTVIRNDRAREIHWSAVGLWTEEDLLALQKELLSKAKPFIDERVRFRVLGDLREFAVQPRDMAEKMRASQEASAQLGVEKMALVCTSVLVKQQFRRVSEALDCEFFETERDAIDWLKG